MKPGFALDLTHEGIALMHRGKGGWVLVGEVKLDAPELPTELGLIRQRALDLSQGTARDGFSTKLIIPPSQILFTTMTAPGPDDVTREARIREGLEGLTPYPISDLVFDWYADGDMTHVAVVVRETLQEAEGFAVENRMNPICFTARAQGSFAREAHFGQTTVAAQHMPSGARIERDEQAPPELMGTRPAPLPKTAEGVNNTDKAGDPNPTPAPAASATTGKDATPQLAAFPPDFEPSERDDGASTPQPPAPTPTPTPTPVPPAPQADKPPQAPRESGVGKAASQTGSGDVPAFSSRRSSTEPAADAPSGPLPNETIAPRIQVTAATPVAQPPKQVHVPVTAPTVDGGAAPSGLKAEKRPAATSKKSGTKGNGKPAAATSEKKSGKQLLAGARLKVKAAAGAATTVGTLGRSKAVAQDSPPTAKPSAAHTAQQTKSGAAISTGTPDAARQCSETEAMTIFGARSEARIGGKPKYLGLALVFGLVLLMGVLAVWSVFFLSDETSELFPDPPDQFESAITTGTTSEQDTDLANADLIEELPADPVDQAQDGAEGSRTPLSPEAAMTRYAATGVWERAPDPLQDPGADQLQDLYIASIDPATHGLDAVALPPGQIDRLLPGVPGQNTRRAPPPKGTVFDLDENGWVRPTPEGSLTPEGVLVFSGRPESAPRLAPEGLFPHAPEEVVETVVALQPPANSPLPRLRPEGLIEQSERALYGGFTRQELAAKRPILRPKSLETRLAAAEAQQANAQASAIASAVEGAAEAAAATATASLVSPTKLAVTRSGTPKPRPRRFDRIIANAPAPEDDSDGSVAVAAAPRNQTVTPKLPTRASVAKQATVKNAIPLRKVALIGIFGSNAKRKALVRLKNGRYVKVGVGDRLDGGRVVSISDSKLIYKKGSRNTTLKILPFS